MKHFSICRLLALSVATIFTCSTAHATDVALTGDAHVNLTRSTANFGTLANLYVGNGNTALLQFDLSALPAGLTASQISRASLTVFVNRVNSGGTVSLSPVTSAWSESAVTYATIPTIGAPVNGFTAAIAGQYVTLDVTSLVQGWVTTPATNFGLALTSTVANVLLDSKENDETGHAASLDITITSMGAQGLQGPAGVQGPQGIQGLPGAPGIQGIPGTAGATGAQGVPGPVGPTGTTGAAGTIGAVTSWSSSVTYQAGQVVFCAACSTSGSSYVALATNTNQDPPTQTGVWQLIASAGATGPQGIQGAQGFQGPIGATGAQGNAGAQGAAGATGPIGPVGPVGPIGVTGPAGPAGATGTTGTIGAVTNWSASTNYQVGQVVFCNACSTGGSTYIALAVNMNQDPPTSSAWQMIAQAGAIGPVGAIGPTGPTGTAGATGPTGAPGAMGATGSIMNGFVWSGSILNAAAGAPQYVTPTSAANYFPFSQLAFLAAPAACTVRSLTVNGITTNLYSSNIEADTTTFTVMKNDAPTSMSCPITNGTANGATYSCSDVNSAHNFTVVQGDRISLRFSETLADSNFNIVSYGTTLICN